MPKITQAGVTQCTSGPWTLDYGGGYGKGDVKSGDQIVARCHIPPRYSKGSLAEDAIQEMEANARLIAAAPDLLVTLERLVTALDNAYVAGEGDTSRAHDAARAAITKARG